MRRHEIEELAQLLALLPPAPAAWAAAAKELPRVRAGLDALVGRAEQDAAERARILADLEGALMDSNLEPSPRLVEEARRRLTNEG